MTHQKDLINVVLFRAIDELSMSIAGNQMKQALDQLNRQAFQFRLHKIARHRLPFNVDLQIGPRRLTSEAFDVHAARLLYYPLSARFQQADIYHITDDFYGGIVRALNPKRCLVTFNHETPYILQNELGGGAGPRYKIQCYIFNAILQAAYIVTASDFMRQHILDRYHVRPERIVRNYYGHSVHFHPQSREVRHKLQNVFQIDPNWFILLHVGNCGPRKNIDLILRALPELPEKIHFVQVGGEWQPAQQMIIREYHLEPRVHRLGFLPHPDLLAADRDALITDSFKSIKIFPDTNLAEIYGIADVFVFPSILEGFGLPLVEAMASNVPVITSNYGTMAEIGGDAAEVIDPLDPRKLAEAIRVLYESPERRQRMKEAGLRRAQDFTWHRHAQTLCDLYEAAYNAL
jgi:glycosyltransferase involved in cell wall biosynthesis